MTKQQISLRDNHTRWTNDFCPLTTDYDREFLRFLSSHTVHELAKEKGLLVYPESFNQGDGNNTVLTLQENTEGVSDIVFTSNIMGFIGNENTDIFIHSRFGSKNNDNFLHYMLMRIAGINIFDMNVSSNKEEKFYDLLKFLFPRMLCDALKQGVIKTYVNNSYNDSNLKGHIDIAKHIRKNKPRNGKVAYDVREYSLDNNITELIRHCIEFIRKQHIGRNLLSANKEVRDAVRTIESVTVGYNSHDTQQLISKNLKTPIHPLYAKYKPLQRLCIAILSHEKYSYGSNNKKIHGILFDGAWLWEEYLSVVLKEDWKHYTSGTHRLLSYSGHPFQPIIPDYISRDKTKVGDAKYMWLQDRKGLDIDRAEAVYYKTIMYMYRFNSNRGYLMFPSNQDNSFRSFEIVETNGKLNMLGLKIDESEDFDEFCHQMRKNEERFIQYTKQLL